VPVRDIGRVETGAGVVLLDERGTPVPVERSGYTHF
jgi:thiamine monophosphate kinase